VLRHAPLLLFDRKEPFLPSRVGYAVHHGAADSCADWRRTRDGDSPLATHLSGFTTVIEYGIWWDWDIQHLYELEAAWVYLDRDDQVLRVEASWHGGYHDMAVDGAPRLRDEHPVLYSQPGKHAFAPGPEWFEPNEKFTLPCRDRAGAMGLHITPLFEGRIAKTPEDDARVLRHLQRFAFTPSFVFDRELLIGLEQLCPWEELAAWIPVRVRELAAQLKTAN
jgi:putative hydrolase of the HAD superfamily